MQLSPVKLAVFMVAVVTYARAAAVPDPIVDPCKLSQVSCQRTDPDLGCRPSSSHLHLQRIEANVGHESDRILDKVGFSHRLGIRAEKLSSSKLDFLVASS